MKYCWVILLSSTISVFLIFANQGSYGRIIVDVHNSFPGATMATLLTTGSAITLLNHLLILVALPLSRLYSPVYTKLITTSVYTCGMLLASCSLNEYQFMMAYGVIAGLGAIGIRTDVFAIGKYFPPNHRFHFFATSFLQCIFPLAMSCTAVYNFIILAYGWRLTYVIYSVTVLTCGVITSIVYSRYEKEPDGIHNTEANNPEADNSRTTKVCILLFVVCNFCLATFINTPMFILTKFAHDEGLSIGKSTAVTAYFGTADLVCRFINIMIGDRFLKGRLLYVYSVGSLAIAIATGIFGLRAHTYNDFIIYSVIVGVLSGPLMTGQYAACYEVSHVLANEIYTIGTVARGFAYTFSLFLCGLIYDSTGSFHNSMIFFICMQVATAIFHAIIILLIK